MTNLLYNDTVARALSQAIADGNASLNHVPGLLRKIITENMLQERIIPESGEVVKFNRFEDFVENRELLKGLGTTMKVLYALCNQDKEVQILLDQVTKKTLNGYGGDRKQDDISSSKVQLGSTGREYTVARLERDGQAELAQRVLNREVTAAEARRQAGWEKEKIAIRLDDPQSAAQTILKRMDRAAIVELLAILAEAIAQRE